LFNNREIATAIWLTLFAAWILTKSDLRKSLAAVIRSFLAWKILASFAAMALYGTLIVLALFAIGFWQPAMIKDTVEWFLFTAVAMQMRFAISRDNVKILRYVFFDNVKIIIVVEFILNTYVMPLPAELVLVPIITFLTSIMTVAQMDEKHALIAKASMLVLGTVGFVVLGFAVLRAISDYRSLGTMNTVRSIAFPPLMSILLVPFIYVMLCVYAYDEAFIRLTIGREKTSKVVRYAKRRIFFHCGLSLRKLRDLTSRPREMMRIESNEDVDRLLSSTDLEPQS
jgi:hypothetical protein